MEDLIERIVKKLAERQLNTLTLSCKEPFTEDRSISDFLHAQTICLENVGALFLKNVAAKNEEEPWVKWLFTGFDYGCSYRLYLAFDCPALIPEVLFENWPLVLISKSGREIQLVHRQVITYQDAALLKEKSILLLQSKQRLTALAEEQLDKTDIIRIERRTAKC